MKSENIFDNIEPIMAWWIDAANATDVGDMAQVANLAIDRRVPFLSVPCDVVNVFWPWIEKTDIKLMARFDFMGNENHDFDVSVSDLSADITTAFRRGADGVQIFVPYSRISDFVNAIKVIKNDLFFDKYVSIGIDIDEKEDIDWQYVFDNLVLINPNSILLVGHEQKFNPNSDFAGRIFDMLQKWNLRSDLHLMFGKNMLRISQVLRLVEKMRPEVSKNIRVFVAP